jgi:hypothetical protein
MPGWRFFSPDGERLIVPDELGSGANLWRMTMRVKVKVTPRSDPAAALENTLTLPLSKHGRAVASDLARVEQTSGLP